MTNSSASKCTVSPGPTSPTPAACNTVTAWVEAEEVEPPSIWPTALDPIKEGAMTVVQQALPEEVAMTIRDEALTRQRDRPRFDVAPERQVGVWPRPGPLAPRDSDGGEVGQQGGGEGRQIGHGSCI